jgi:zinc protease
MDSLADSIAELVQFDLPEDYFQSLQNRVSTLSPAQVEEAATAIINPDRMVWIVVGDTTKLERSLTEAGIGHIRIVAAGPQDPP